MARQDNISDSTDWLPTPLSALSPLESSLRCQVCKDFFTTPMMTSCSHTFCSLCIRRYLSQEGRCPACREQDQEMKLRRNWVVEELVVNFKDRREGLLELARGLGKKLEQDREERPKKRRKVTLTGEVNGNTNGIQAERRSTRSQTKQIASQTSQQSQVYSVPSTQEEIADTDEGSVFEDADSHSIANSRTNAVEPNDGLVACPCCGRRMKEAVINSHLDSCINGDSSVGVDSSSPAPPRSLSNTPAGGQSSVVSLAYTQTKPSSATLERLPFINYSLLSDNALRKKLKELGINSFGSKELMRKRHTEWINLWNANSDSRDPVSKRQLLLELDKWEKTTGKQIERSGSTGGGSNSSGGGVMNKEFDREGYVKTQKGNFDELIKKAREKRATSTPVSNKDGTDEKEEISESPAPDGQPNGIEERTLPTMKEIFSRKPEVDVPRQKQADQFREELQPHAKPPEVDVTMEYPPLPKPHPHPPSRQQSQSHFKQFADELREHPQQPEVDVTMEYPPLPKPHRRPQMQPQPSQHSKQFADELREHPQQPEVDVTMEYPPLPRAHPRSS